MSESHFKLFSLPENRRVIRKIKESLEAITYEPDTFVKKRNSHLIYLLNYIYESNKDWDELCQVNIEYIGEHFNRYVSSLETNSDLDLLYSYLLRFACECYLSSGDIRTGVFDFIEFAEQRIKLFDKAAQSHMEYAIRFTPIMVTKRIINGSELQHVLQFNEVTQQAKELKETWDNEIKDKQVKVDLLKASLDEQETGYNFVGLHKGFNQLSTEKEEEKKWSFRWVLLLGSAILVLIGFEFYFVCTQNGVAATPEIMASSNYLRLIPMFSGVLILLYFFRIALMDYKSVKSQILQIELRKTLCQFIQSYSDYSNEIKEKDGDALAKFENIIFSGIVADEGKIPSTFDGLDQLTKLAQAMKK